MTPRFILIGLMSAVMLAAPFSTAQSTPDVPQKDKMERDYTSLLSRVKEGDLSVDFRAFRLAAALGGRSADAREFIDHGATSRLLVTGNYHAALDSATKTLERNYASLYGQFDATVACQKLGMLEDAAKHQKLLNALVESIRVSGDGKSPESAWFVVNTPEEYFLLRQQLHLVPKKQELFTIKGHAYDRLDVVDPQTNSAQSVWFNTDVDMHLYRPENQTASPVQPSDASDDLRPVASAQVLPRDDEPVIRWGNFNIVQQPPGIWSAVYTLSGTYKLRAHSVSITVESSSATVADFRPENEVIHLQSLELGVCYQMPSGQWDMYPPKGASGIKIPLHAIALKKNEIYHFPAGALRIPLPEEPLPSKNWLCASLMGRVGESAIVGSYPAHDENYAVLAP